jgi:hypothetical protein
MIYVNILKFEGQIELCLYDKYDFFFRQLMMHTICVKKRKKAHQGKSNAFMVIFGLTKRDRIGAYAMIVFACKPCVFGLAMKQIVYIYHNWGPSVNNPHIQRC